MCRKLETEEEKVLPFYASTLTEQEEQEIDTVVKQEPENQLAQVLQWQLYNTVGDDQLVR